MHAEPDLFPPDPFEAAEASLPKRRRRPAGKSPNARSMELLRERGYKLVDKVEQRVPNTFITRDLFGIADILAVGADVVLVQATSSSNMASRIDKVTHHESTPILRKAGIRILVHGWGKRADGLWHCREVDLS